MAIPKTLFIASPFGFDPAYTFTRAASAFQINSDGVLESVSTDLLRIDHLDLDGDGIRETPAFKLEEDSTNLITRADEFDDVAWTASNVTVEANSGEAADGSTDADLIVPSTLTNTHQIGQTLGVTDSVDHALTVYASPGGYDFLSLRVLGNGTANAARAHFELTSSGAVVDSDTIGTGTLTRTDIDRLRDGIYRCTLVGQISTSTALDADFFVAETSSQMATSWAGAGSSGGLGVRLWGGQLEDDKPVESSLMLSSAAAAVRNAETLFFDFTAPPQEMTVYAKFVDRGVGGSGLAKRIIHIGAASSITPRFELLSIGADDWQAFYTDGTLSFSSNPTNASTIGDTVEIRGVYSPASGLVCGVSINGGAEVVGAASDPFGVPASWAASRIYVGFSDNIFTLADFPSIKVATGIKTLAEMRSLNPFFGVLTSAIPVAQDSVDGDRQEIGDRDRTFDGTLRETIRSRVSGWSGTTVPLTQADKNEVQALLESSTQPQTSFGEMIAGSTGDFPNVFTTVTSIAPVQSGTQRRYVLGFDVQESS